MIEIIEGLPKKVVGIAVKGRVTIEDCRDVLMPAMKKSLQRLHAAISDLSAQRSERMASRTKGRCFKDLG